MNKKVKELYVMFKLIGESTVFAFSSLKTDKFRTFLSLLGVSIGIFSIVAVFCAVDALQNNISEGLKSLGGDVVMIDKYPWNADNGEEFAWWEYWRRPNIDDEDYKFLKKNVSSAEAVVYVSMFNKLLKNGRNSFENGYVIATSPDFEKVSNAEIEEGRNFSMLEFNNGTSVALVGYNVAESLYPEGSPLGKTIKIGGFTATIVGVLKKQGESIASIFDFDNAVAIPLNYGKNMYNIKRGGTLIVLPRKDVSFEDFESEVRVKMRARRRLAPNDKDNFAINAMSFVTNTFGQIFSVINLVGWVIGGFSLLIGGFGIANIMFVSVKERTNQIGIQKALGAKKYVIMTQFLVEAAVLSLAGGLLGILLVYIATLFFKDVETFKLTLSAVNAIKGLAIALVIGIISGLIPAYAAAKLDPVKAING